MSLEAHRETLIKHARSSKNGIFPKSYQYASALTNPVCGDHIELKIQIDTGHVQEIGFRAAACAICSASASLLIEGLKGKSTDQALHISRIFEDSVVNSKIEVWPTEISFLNCFEHLKVNPSRRMCALLPWIVLRNALKEDSTLQ